MKISKAFHIPSYQRFMESSCIANPKTKQARPISQEHALLHHRRDFTLMAVPLFGHFGSGGWAR
jgi:hypothetical protein